MRAQGVPGKQNDNMYFVVQFQKKKNKEKKNRITVSQSKGRAHQQPGPVGELSGHVSIQAPRAYVHPGTQLWLLCTDGGQANAPKLMPIPMPKPWDREPSKLKSMFSVSIKSLSRMESTSQSRLLGTFSISRLAAIRLWELCCCPW